LDLPTYTNIWRIEKRLYKLYDFRLPMPLPVGQIAVFAAIAVPYVVILKVVGLPFSHTLLWLYVLPPGALAWLVTRPVLEGKRLPELVVSQLRYLSEPRTWCRMAPLAEKDDIVVVARVWRRVGSEVIGDETGAASHPPVVAQAEEAEEAEEAEARETPDQGARPVPAHPAAEAAAPPTSGVPDQGAGAVRVPDKPQDAPQRPRPVVTVTGEQHAERPLRMVERALGNPAERRATGWHDHVVMVPGGHRPGRPDQLQRDRARARLPVPGRRRIVVLGCSVGAGQTVTTLLTGELLASLRDDQVAVLDLSAGTGSLAERVRAVAALTGSRPPAPSRLEVVTREAAAGGQDPGDAAKIFELLSARYPLTLADPGAAAVPRVLAVADQLILVAPASQDAASALATTREWLEAHGHTELADGAITVLNGVSRHTMPHVEQAEALARGRCRAIVRVPWDDDLTDMGPERIAVHLPGTSPAGPAAGPLSPAALHAYTALAGVLVAALASQPERLRARS
jgi:TcpE family